jgi:hypothetical protein
MQDTAVYVLLPVSFQIKINRSSGLHFRGSLHTYSAYSSARNL